MNASALRAAGRILLQQRRFMPSMVTKKHIGGSDKMSVGKKLLKMSVDSSIEEKMTAFKQATTLQYDAVITSTSMAESMVDTMKKDIVGKPFVHINGGPGLVAIGAIKAGAISGTATDTNGIFFPLMLNYLRFYGNFHVHRTKYEFLVLNSTETSDNALKGMKYNDMCQNIVSIPWESEDHPLVIMGPLLKKRGYMYKFLAKSYDLRGGLFNYGRPVLYTVVTCNSNGQEPPTWYSKGWSLADIELACRYHIECIDNTLPISLMISTTGALDTFQKALVGACLLRLRPKLKPDFLPGVVPTFVASVMRALSAEMPYAIKDATALDAAMVVSEKRLDDAIELLKEAALPGYVILGCITPIEWVRLARHTEEMFYNRFDALCRGDTKAADTALDLRDFS